MYFHPFRKIRPPQRKNIFEKYSNRNVEANILVYHVIKTRTSILKLCEIFLSHFKMRLWPMKMTKIKYFSPKVMLRHLCAP